VATQKSSWSGGVGVTVHVAGPNVTEELLHPACTTTSRTTDERAPRAVMAIAWEQLACPARVLRKALGSYHPSGPYKRGTVTAVQHPDCTFGETVCGDPRSSRP